MSVGVGLRRGPRGATVVAGPRADRFEGFGLYLADRLSDRWGAREGGRTTVWFEIDD